MIIIYAGISLIVLAVLGWALLDILGCVPDPKKEEWLSP